MARRAGWVLLSCAVLAMAGARVGPPSWHGGLIAAAVACGLLGLIAIVNVAVVRGLYRGVNHGGEATPPTDRS